MSDSGRRADGSGTPTPARSGQSGQPGQSGQSGEPAEPAEPSQSGELGMAPADLIEALLELATRAGIEVRILPRAEGRASEDDLRPRESAACRVGERVWVMLAPEDPPLQQAEVLAGSLVRHRATFLQESFLLPAVRAFIDRVEI